MKKIINIDGMNCSHCVEKVEGALYGLPQVDDVKINLEGKKAEVEFNSEISNDLLENLVNSAGHYTVTNITEG